MLFQVRRLHSCLSLSIIPSLQIYLLDPFIYQCALKLFPHLENYENVVVKVMVHSLYQICDFFLT